MIVTFERRRIDPHRMYGVVVSESDSLLLLHHAYDFVYDGYVAIRRCDITKSFTSDSNRYTERLMRKEGLWSRPPKSVRELPVENWHALLSSLAGKPVVIENERKGDFYIGPVVSCDARFVSIHYFNGCGEWGDVERVRLTTITTVKFGDRYSTIHHRHLPPKPNL